MLTWRSAIPFLALGNLAILAAAARALLVTKKLTLASAPFANQLIEIGLILNIINVLYRFFK